MKPYLDSEADDKRRVMEEVMRLLSDGTLPTQSGARTGSSCPDSAVPAPSRLLRNLHTVGRVARLCGIVCHDKIMPWRRAMPLPEISVCVAAGAYYAVTDAEAVRTAVRETLKAGRGGKLFLEG